MFQTTFFITLQMFFKKLNAIFFHKPLKTLNMCIFPSTIRYFWLKYFFNVWEKYWHESTLQGNSKNHNIKMLFKTKKTKLEFKLPWTIIFLALLLLSSFWSCLFVFIDISLNKNLLQGKKVRSDFMPGSRALEV